MVPPSMHRIVEDLFTGENLTFAITIPDVMNNARLKDDPILDEEADQRGILPHFRPYVSIDAKLAENHFSAESQNKIGLLKAKYRFGDYGSYKEMIKFMRTIEFYYPNFTKIIRIGMTHEGSPIEDDIFRVRLWRKNRSPQKCVRSLWGGRQTGSSTNPCSNLYQGEKVFSEPESRAVRDFLMSKEMKNKLDAFITLHTYAQLWIHPYSHETETYPMDYIELKRTAKRAIDKLKSVYGTQYKIGTGADTLAPASGGSDDWAKGVLGVKYVYLVELRPELECDIVSNGFILNKYELIPTAVETWEAVQVVMTSVLRAKRLSEGDSRLPSLFMRKQL
uniref:Peptidase M14 carboxypeptidase A domain-containing protein n=1 Tax=Parascaris equorum TaxID=6256 RepID=A0A914RXA6_PAREQ